jgi:hypothetical protein
MNWLPNEMQQSKQSKNSDGCSSTVLANKMTTYLRKCDGTAAKAMGVALSTIEVENWQLEAGEHRTIVRTPQACQNPPGGVSGCGIVRCHRSRWLIGNKRKSLLRPKTLPVLLRPTVPVCRTTTHAKLTCIADEPSLEVMYRIDFLVASK